MFTVINYTIFYKELIKNTEGWLHNYMMPEQGRQKGKEKASFSCPIQEHNRENMKHDTASSEELPYNTKGIPWKPGYHKPFLYQIHKLNAFLYSNDSDCQG